MQELFEIVHEDADLLVVNKRAGLVCHPTKGNAHSSLIGRVREYLEREQRSPRFVNRLDRETSGIVVVAKSGPVAGEIGRIWENRKVEKVYRAIVHGHVRERHGIIDHPLGKDKTSQAVIKDCVRVDGAPARTEFWTEWRCSRAEGNFSLLRIKPHTGRKHQIRIHLAYHRHPIVGDKLYGGDENLYLDFVKGRLSEEQKRRLILPHHGLHAGELRFDWRGRPWVFLCEPEPWFSEFVGFGLRMNYQCSVPLICG